MPDLGTEKGEASLLSGLFSGLWEGHPFPGWGRKYQMHCSSTRYISLVSNKGSPEPNLSALAFLRSAGGSGTDGGPWPGPEHPLG